ncbi:putative xylanase/chitin deacetylase [Schinkia azotoformans MEV2011]|uniref:Putative xylanase/chitin deacetylase n=1 Tax=Schinkia azotoformans MEV2011 TaxID=1348973 RepID=A0A072NXJ8_SCHAZ|nr:polysaccharide deacetylase family protein [Schinkia azotoformans]KEF37965.1 putative xylanase/chitin deacetylase [Schinkia azotoformans MEV2011]MEC1696323.1 polysaccharide deacetylase [Schinkia azotoformans]MEC1717398.1 polysaccharide deacetylase [Schinkia azotoformans]MEC1727281.1 polysaccharide deacetylase [Schinkia azotoformans]MEC1740172.1 polysaccharide deacetylase [Schinkia azotoformans]
MKHYLKTFALLIVISSLPIIFSNIFNFPSFKAQSDGLKGKEGSHFISSIEKKQLSPSFPVDEQINKVIYLTFDDGPNGYTQDILNILQSKNAHATFFLIKGNIDKHPTLLKEIIKKGNAVGCHSVSHRVDVFYSSPKVAINEMKVCQRAIYDQTRFHTPLIRVPFGSFPHLTNDIKNGLENENFIYWDWNIDSEDWTNNNPGQVYTNIVKQLNLTEKKGYIPTVLLHDKQVTVEMLPKLLDYLNEKGYKIKSITNANKPVQFNLHTSEPAS